MLKTLSAICAIGLALTGIMDGAAWAQNAPPAQQRPAGPVKNAPRPAVPASPAQAPAEQPPVSNVPAMTTATFGDWVMRCRSTDTGANAAKSCEVAQTLQVQGQGPIAEIAFGKPAGESKMMVVVVLPNNVALADPVGLSVDEKDKALELGYRRCLPTGCYADSEAKDDVLTRWRAQTGAGRLRFKDGGNREIALPFSFRGLAQALDAMAKS